jgi:hypothetical protein
MTPPRLVFRFPPQVNVLTESTAVVSYSAGLLGMEPGRFENVVEHLRGLQVCNYSSSESRPRGATRPINVFPILVAALTFTLYDMISSMEEEVLGPFLPVFAC